EVARGARIEDGEGEDEEDADPGEQESRAGLAALAAGEDGGRRHESGEDDPAGVNRQHRSVREFGGELLETVRREVPGEDGGRRGPRREALKELEGGDGKRGNEEHAGTPVEEENRRQEDGLIGGKRG